MFSHYWNLVRILILSSSIRNKETGSLLSPCILGAHHHTFLQMVLHPSTVNDSGGKKCGDASERVKEGEDYYHASADVHVSKASEKNL